MDSKVNEKAGALFDVLAGLYDDFTVDTLPSTYNDGSHGVGVSLKDTGQVTWGSAPVILRFQNDDTYGPRWADGAGNLIPHDRVLLTVANYVANRR